MTALGPDPKLDQRRVVWSVTPDQSRSPYIVDIVGGLRSAGWTVDALSLRDLSKSQNQIVHIQWPEHVSRGGGTAKTAAKHLRAIGLLTMIRLRRHHIVVTAHNIAPHGESDRFDAWFRKTVLRRARAMVVLVPGHEEELREHGQLHSNVRVVVSPEPIVPEPALEQDDTNETPNSLLVLGLIHPYHRISEFVDALAARGNSRPVEVIGSVGDSSLLANLEQKASDHDWLTVSAGYADDEELPAIVDRTAAVVSLQRVPFNSGGAFFALARNLPVILTEGAQAKHMKEEVGADWVFEVPTNERALDLASLDAWLEIDRSSPSLEQYSVDLVAQQHIDLYELLLDEG